MRVVLGGSIQKCLIKFVGCLFPSVTCQHFLCEKGLLT